MRGLRAALSSLSPILFTHTHTHHSLSLSLLLFAWQVGTWVGYASFLIQKFGVRPSQITLLPWDSPQDEAAMVLALLNGTVQALVMDRPFVQVCGAAGRESLLSGVLGVCPCRGELGAGACVCICGALTLRLLLAMISAVHLQRERQLDAPADRAGLHGSLLRGGLPAKHARRR